MVMTQPIITHRFQDRDYYFHDTPQASSLISEIFSDNYHVLQSAIDFPPGSIILDLGANEGMFSIYMAGMFPLTRIIALEPVPRTFYHLQENIKLNSFTNIEVYNVGVGKPGQKTCIINVGLNDWSGGSSSKLTFDPTKTEQVECGMISLDDVFEMYGIEKCRLLKIDIEGAEYDALYPSHVLPKTDYMVGEFHMNQRITFESRRMDALATWCYNQTKLIHIDTIHMAE
jgi:FkbM family methyltransferase